MEDWKSSSRRLKNLTKNLLAGFLHGINRYEPYTRQELQYVQGKSEYYDGDVPAGGTCERFQSRVSYLFPRISPVPIDSVIYHPGGTAWKDGRLIRRMCIREPSIREHLVRSPSRAIETVSNGIILEGETPYTYGDWVGELLLSLVHAPETAGPLVLPSFLAEKHYVKRDVQTLGRELLPVTQPVLIKKATLLRKIRPSFYWTKNDVNAYRRAMKVDPPVVKPGSIVYLSREHVKSEVSERRYPSNFVSTIIRNLGGLVIDTSKASPSMFDEIADQAETVILDQGSAIFGVLHWRTKRVLELTTDNWWHNFSLFLSRAADVEDFHIIVVDRHDNSSLAKRIVEFLKK